VTEPLALKYRPRSFEDIVGQPVVRTVLSKMVSDRTVPSGLLFTGVRGAGKTTTGRIVAAGLNCEKHPVGPCGHCPSCSAVFGGNSLDVIEIDAASSGLVADVRTLTEMVQYSTGGEYRVVLLDEAHAARRASQVETEFNWPTTKAGAKVINDRCASCHEQPARRNRQ